MFRRQLGSVSHLDGVEGMVGYLDLEDGPGVVVEDVPAVEDAVLAHTEKH